MKLFDRTLDDIAVAQLLDTQQRYDARDALLVALAHLRDEESNGRLSTVLTPQQQAWNQLISVHQTRLEHNAFTL